VGNLLFTFWTHFLGHYVRKIPQGTAPYGRTLSILVAVYIYLCWYTDYVDLDQMESLKFALIPFQG